MGIYAWHKLLPYPVLPFCPLASPPAAAVAKQKGKPTFLLKLPFNHWIIASAGTSLSHPQLPLRHPLYMSVSSLAYLISSSFLMFI